MASSNAVLAHAQEKELWNKYNKTEPNSTEQMHQLLYLAEYYSSIQGDFLATDTLCFKASKIAQTQFGKTEQLLCYKHYFEIKERMVITESEMRYKAIVENWLKDEKSKQVLWNINYLLALYNFDDFNFDEALRLAQKSNVLAQYLDEYFQIKSLLTIGKIYNRLENNTEALQYLLRALDRSNSFNDFKLKLDVLEELAVMFSLNESYEKAMDYRKLKLELIQNQPELDSLLYLREKLELLQIKSYIDFDGVLPQLEKLLALSKEKKYTLLYNNTWATYRSTLIERNEFGILYQLYTQEHAHELKTLQENNSSLYFRLQAYFSEFKGDLKKADDYWQMAISNPNGKVSFYVNAHLYLRYTEFLVRYKKLDRAYRNAVIADSWARKAQFYQFMIKTKELLQQIEYDRGHYKEAYELALVKNQLELEQSNQFKKEGLLVLEMQHAIERDELIRQKEEEQRQADLKSAKFKSNAFAVGSVVFLFLSAIIFRQYRNTRREKQRSDGLLLNILPENTANELKAKGFTTAREYQNVTVLFSDIVGFTTMSEQLSPEDLVKELDTYFRAFDGIMDTYGLEKIKTVGDAYVAVGGMPMENKATAKNVAEAAIAMQKITKKLALERISQKRPYFVLRVGLNTGSVVAGVVGYKKFQFDIWGDTVNVAARMEQNSEPKKINISESTYQLVKDNFECVSRGKIEAKNKGFIQMFYINF